MSANLYDADATLQAIQPPTLRLGGTEYQGRALGYSDRLELQQRLDDLVAAQTGADMSAFRPWLHDVFTAMDLPAEELLRLPESVVWRAVNFFLSVGRYEAEAPPSLPTDGSVSPPEADGA